MHGIGREVEATRPSHGPAFDASLREQVGVAQHGEDASLFPR